MDRDLVATIRKTLEGKSTAELREAYESGDKATWSSEAFEAMRQLLEERATKPVPPPAPLATASGGSLGGFFLFVGAGICLLGCVFTIVKTVYGLCAPQPQPPMVAGPGTEPGLSMILVLLDGFVWFFLSAALFVVFVRVSRLK